MADLNDAIGVHRITSMVIAALEPPHVSSFYALEPSQECDWEKGLAGWIDVTM